MWGPEQGVWVQTKVPVSTCYVTFPPLLIYKLGVACVNLSVRALYAMSLCLNNNLLKKAGLPPPVYRRSRSRKFAQDPSASKATSGPPCHYIPTVGSVMTPAKVDKPQRWILTLRELPTHLWRGHKQPYFLTSGTEIRWFILTAGRNVTAYDSSSPLSMLLSCLSPSEAKQASLSSLADGNTENT